jgi:hypothetical protein
VRVKKNTVSKGTVGFTSSGGMIVITFENGKGGTI